MKTVTGRKKQTSLEEICLPISNEIALVKAELKSQIRQIHNSRIPVDDIIGYFFKAPGKYLRPILLLLSAGAISPGADRGLLVNLAAAVELIHSASLIHDDIIDNDVLRRGQKTLNRFYGNQVAVLAGDVLYARAFHLAISLNIPDHRTKTAILGELCRSTENMCIGEMGESPENDYDAAQYLKIIEGKTASLTSLSCHIPALLFNTGEKVKDALKEYGYCFGMLYQIMDDIGDKNVNVRNFDAYRCAGEYKARAVNALGTLDDSIYKEKLSEMADYIS